MFLYEYLCSAVSDRCSLSMSKLFSGLVNYSEHLKERQIMVLVKFIESLEVTKTTVYCIF